MDNPLLNDPFEEYQVDEYRADMPHYHRYYGEHRPLWLNRPHGDWRRAAKQQLVRAGAGCFFEALFTLCSRQVAAAMIQAYEQGQGVLRLGVSFVRAVEILDEIGFQLNVLFFGRVADELRVLFRHNGRGEAAQRGWGLALVPLNDEGEFIPHWLPFTQHRDHLGVRLIGRDHLALDEQEDHGIEEEWVDIDADDVAHIAAELEELRREAEGPWDHELGAELPFFGLGAELGHIGPPLVAGLAPAPEVWDHDLDVELPFYGLGAELGFIGPDWAGEAILGRAPVRPDGTPWEHIAPVYVRPAHPLDGIVAVVGEHAPPAPTTRAGSNLVECRTFYWLGEGQLQFGGDYSLVDGPPGAFARAAARVQGRGGICWELRPSNIRNMHVDSKHMVYVRLGEASLLDPAVMDTGDFNPQLVGRLHSATGCFRLDDPWEVRRDDGAVFLFFNLKRTSVTLSGVFGRCLPFHLEPIERVSLVGVGVARFSRPESAYPSRVAYLRAQFSILAATAPAELVGLINDQRNIALALLEEGRLATGFDPYRMVAVLHEQRKQAQRLFTVLGCAAAVFACA